MPRYPLVLIAMLLLPATVQAASTPDPVDFMVSGHRFEIREIDHDQSIWIDGVEVHENAFVSIHETTKVDGVPVIVGTTVTGGNRCNESWFVVSFPEGHAPIFDNPIDTCTFLHETIEADDISFTSRPNTLDPGEHWIWQPGIAGFERAADIPFVASIESGWDALMSRQIEFAFDMFDYADINQQVDALLGVDRENVLRDISESGNGTYAGTTFSDFGCYAYDCISHASLIVFDTQSRLIYVAWTADDVETIRPDPSEWPVAAAGKLDEWEDIYIGVPTPQRTAPPVPSGWNALMSGQIHAASGLFSYVNLDLQLNALLGANRDTFLLAMNDAGDGTYGGELFTAAGCMLHDCATGSGLVVANIRTQQIYIAWTDHGTETVVPDRSTWPALEANQLSNWENAPAH